MVILGIDPGYATVGFGIIKQTRQEVSVLQYGVITTPAGVPLPERLKQIYEDMCQLLDAFAPDALSIEELFFNSNVTTAINVAQSRGVILLAAQNKGVPIFECTPLQVKQAVTGYGRADKRQVIEMTQRILKMPQPAKPDDAADALAIAVCHARRSTSAIFRANNYDA